MAADRAAPVRIAMWSGPRNISTAMMRSFEARGDCAVCDEPFYAAYLAATGLGHPMRDEIIAAGEADPDRVIAGVLGPVPDGASLYYQKHMTHHMIPAFDRDWLKRVVNCFLIRAPERVLASYAIKHDAVGLDDIGFVQQRELFDLVADFTGAAPPVLDAADVLKDPAGSLRALCRRCGIAFCDKMLSWPAGARRDDGVWGAHWYGAVNRSTGFAPASDESVDLPDDLKRIAEAARPAYDALARYRLG